MQFTATEPKNRGFSNIVLKHGLETMDIPVRGYSEIKIYSDPFYEINEFISTLSEQEQFKLFEIYRQLENDFIEETGFRIDGLIKKAIKQIYDIVRLDRLASWLFTNTSFIIPSKTEEDDEARTKSRDMNYDQEDYCNLALFSLALRFLIPIWGQLADEKRKTDENSEPVSNNKFFEMKLLKYIDDTPLVEMPAWDKLRRYCEASFQSTVSRNDKCEVFSNILQGLASTEIPTWIRAKAVFRKIHVFPIFERTANGVKHTLIASLHFEVKASLRSNMSKKASDKLRPKRNISDDANEEERNSNLEQYKIKYRAIEGDLMLYQYYTSDIHRVKARLIPELPEQLFDMTLSNQYRLRTEIIHPHQIVLIQWVLCPVMTPKSIPRLPKDNLCSLIALTQACLWFWGFKELAAFMTVRRSESDTAKISAPPSKRGAFSKQHQEHLKELFPHEHPATTARNTLDHKLLDHNFAINEIHELTEFMFGTAWRYIGPKELIVEIPELSSEGGIVPPSDLRTHLMELAILVAERFKTFK